MNTDYTTLLRLWPKSFNCIVNNLNAKVQLFVLLSIAAITAKGDIVRLEDEKMTFTLPAGWVAIPQRIIDEYQANVHKRLVKPNSLTFKYGYQILGAEWFDYPYVLIRNQLRGKIPEDQLRQLPTLDISALSAEARDMLSPIITNMSANKVSYDPKTKKIWSELRITAPTGALVSGLMLMQATEEGITTFYFYATAEQYNELKPLFVKIATSVTPDPEIAYRPEGATNELEIQKTTTDAEGLNAFLHLAGFALTLLCWLLPGIIASKRNHPKKISIWYLTAFLGWTGIGWIPAMIWACWRIPELKPATDLEPLKLDDDDK